MQDPANMPLEVMCHDRAMKQESTVYQFHSMLILQPPPILMLLPPCDIPVPDAIAALPVAVGIIPAIPDMLDIATDVAGIAIVCPEWSITLNRVLVG